MFNQLLDLLNTTEKQSVSNEPNDYNKSQITAIALLIELSKADYSIDPIETQAILEIAKQNFQLTDEIAKKLYDSAFNSNQEATSLYEYTDIINRDFTKKEKINLIYNMWEVAFIDNKIDRYEEHTIRKIADLIYVSHGDFLQAKHRAKKTLPTNAC